MLCYNEVITRKILYSKQLRFYNCVSVQLVELWYFVRLEQIKLVLQADLCDLRKSDMHK